jgi:hypothetical protein
MVGFCEHSDEPLGSVIYCEFLRQLNNYQLVKKDLIPELSCVTLDPQSSFSLVSLG